MGIFFRLQIVVWDGLRMDISMVRIGKMVRGIINSTTFLELYELCACNICFLSRTFRRYL